MVASSEAWGLAMNWLILPASFYSTETFFSTENGSTTTILGFLALGLTQQLLGCLSIVKTPSAPGNVIKFHCIRWRPVHWVAENWVLYTPGCESLTQWPPRGICSLDVINLAFMRCKYLTFLRDACLISHKFETTCCLLQLQLFTWQSCVIQKCSHFQIVWNVLIVPPPFFFFLFLLPISKWKQFLRSTRVVGRDTVWFSSY